MSKYAQPIEVIDFNPAYGQPLRHSYRQGHNAYNNEGDQHSIRTLLFKFYFALYVYIITE